MHRSVDTVPQSSVLPCGRHSIGDLNSRTRTLLIGPVHSPFASAAWLAFSDRAAICPCEMHLQRRRSIAVRGWPDCRGAAECTPLSGSALNRYSPSASKLLWRPGSLELDRVDAALHAGDRRATLERVAAEIAPPEAGRDGVRLDD